MAEWIEHWVASLVQRSQLQDWELRRNHCSSHQLDYPCRGENEGNHWIRQSLWMQIWQDKSYVVPLRDLVASEW